MKLDWIPQFFLDFIGRIVPGASVLLAGLVVWTGKYDVLASLLSKQDGGINWALLLPLLVCCYLLGFSLTQLWHQTLRRFTDAEHREIEVECKKECFEEHNRLQTFLGGVKLTGNPDDLPRRFVMHDQLRITLPDQASRLLKMRAEQRLCQCLILGFGFLCIVNVWFSIEEPTFARILTELVMLVMVFTSWKRALRLEKLLTNGVCDLWFTLASSHRLFKPPGSASSKQEAKD